MNEVLTLIGADGSRDVFCRVRSVGMKEFYEASARDFHPELVFVLADYLDYSAEQQCRHSGRLYHVLRTYRSGQELEIVVTQASAEEVEMYG
ncbi:MAG: hypothetical protein J6V15_02470 [Clostridia bacterium]|nr:hypothetical protein [Clostridia bacterium]